MTKGKSGKRRKKHVPQRTCVGCRTVQPKRSLIRIVRNQDGVKVDPTGRASGRGAYLHSLRNCWQQALKGSLSKALKTEIKPEDLEHLKAFMETLPEETPDDNNKKTSWKNEFS